MENLDSLRKIDLNLLVIFYMVMQEKNVTRAAKKLKLSQPGVSFALTRLKKVLGYELFSRQGRNIIPTPQACLLYYNIKQPIELINEKIFLKSPCSSG